jgi:methylated-DNA-[protein]-cysteine S-methyltransferase
MNNLLAESVDLAVSFPTELGWMAIGFLEAELCELKFGYPSRVAVEHALGADIEFSDSNRKIAGIVRKLQDFALGERVDFSKVGIALHVHSPFTLRVLRECRKVGYGKTVSYAELAARAGSPRAARAVGNIMANNRIPLIIPCHRIVGSNGALGGYSSPRGIEMKRILLANEQRD